jgi:hypothetical protein
VPFLQQFRRIHSIDSNEYVSIINRLIYDGVRSVHG